MKHAVLTLAARLLAALAVQPAPAFVLGMFEPRNGKFQLRLEVGGANPASQGAKYSFGLDCLMLEKP